MRSHSKLALSLLVLAFSASRASALTLSAAKYAPIGYVTQMTVLDTLTTNSFTYTMPAGITFYSVNAPLFNCTTPAVGDNGPVTCQRAFSGYSDPVLIAFNTPLTTSAGTVLQHQLAASPGSTSASATQTAQPVPDLEMTSTFPTTFVAGQPVTYTFTVHNRGTIDATNLVLADHAPQFTTWFRSGLTQLSGPSFTCPSATGPASILQTLPGTLPAGGTVTFSSTMYSDPGQWTIPARHFVTTAFRDFNIMLFGADTTVQATQSADIVLTSSAAATTTAGADLTYFVSVACAGPSSAGPVTYAWTTPPGTTFLGLQTPSLDPPDELQPAQCTTPPIGSAGTVTCTLSQLSPAVPDRHYPATVSVVLLHVRAPLTPGTITNSVTATTANDPNLANNTSSATTQITSTAPDLSAALTAPAASDPDGGVLATLTIHNDGPSPAAGVVATVTSEAESAQLPAGCSQSTRTTITCSMASLDAGATSTLPLQLTFATAGTKTINATVSSAAGDPNPQNDTASAAVLVRLAADVALIAPISPQDVSPGQVLDFTFGGSNHGPHPASDVVVTAVLPANLTITSLPPGCTLTGTTVQCTAGTLVPNQSATFPLKVSAPLSGVTQTTFSVSTSSLDGDPTNNSRDVVATVEQGSSPLLRITTDPPSLSVVPGQLFTFTVRVQNIGSGASQNVQVADDLPAGVELLAATPSSGSCAGTDPILCQLGVLSTGASATLTISARAPQSGNGMNTATAVSPPGWVTVQTPLTLLPTSRHRAARH